MATVIDYVHESTDTFDERPVCRLDGLVFSWLANMRLPENVADSTGERGLTLAQIAKLPNVSSLTMPMHDSAGTLELLSACARSERFKGIRCCRAVSEWSESVQRQFAAVTFLLPQGAYLAFRGTDDTIVGWKENFNMSFRSFVPAQEDAREYLERACAYLDGRIWLGGHSKGGNLAMYAAACCASVTRARIERCHAFDAPGLSSLVIEASRWSEVAPLIDSVVPEESLVGLIWSNPDVKPTVVMSSGIGLLQHAPLSWQVKGQDFACVSAVSYEAYLVAKRFGAWLETRSSEDRERVVELLYRLVQATGRTTASGLVSGLADGSLIPVVANLEGLTEAERGVFVGELEDLAATMLLGPSPKVPQTPQERVQAKMDKAQDAAARFGSTMSKIDRLLGGR